MEKGTKNIFLYVIGSIVFITLILSIIKFVIMEEFVLLLWFCYIGLLLISIGIFTKNSSLILSQVLILAIPELFWIIDFLVSTITGSPLFGFASYIFNSTRIPLENFLSLFHIYIIPLAISALAITKIKIKDYKALIISFTEIFIIFILGITINFGEYSGINCLPTPEECSSIIFPSFLPYFVWWWIILSFSILISYLIINHLNFLKKNKKEP